MVKQCKARGLYTDWQLKFTQPPAFLLGFVLESGQWKIQSQDPWNQKQRSNGQPHSLMPLPSIPSQCLLKLHVWRLQPTPRLCDHGKLPIPGLSCFHQFCRSIQQGVIYTNARWSQTSATCQTSASRLDGFFSPSARCQNSTMKYANMQAGATCCVDFPWQFNNVMLWLGPSLIQAARHSSPLITLRKPNGWQNKKSCGHSKAQAAGLSPTCDCAKGSSLGKFTKIMVRGEQENANYVNQPLHVSVSFARPSHVMSWYILIQLHFFQCSRVEVAFKAKKSCGHFQHLQSYITGLLGSRIGV